MLLSPISYLDCLIFTLLLIPQLLLQIGILPTLYTALSCLPFLLFRLPLSLLSERFILPTHARLPSVQHATFFQDLIIHCVRHAFRTLPLPIGRVFFSAAVTQPFLRWRMLRHGHLQSPTYYRAVQTAGFHGLWVVADELRAPDVVVYYAHGGGFAMGSSHFYLEFLLSLVHMLQHTQGFSNPAVLALDYSLAPEAAWPTQLNEALAGYEHALNIVEDGGRICVAGDSAGGTLMLSLLLCLATEDLADSRPALASLISPWVTLDDRNAQAAAGDYLDLPTLRAYARQYAGKMIDDPLVSPGRCRDMDLWRRAAPLKGFQLLFGSEEVLAPEVRRLGKVLRSVGVAVEECEAVGGVHAWPVSELFLGETQERRLRGISEMAAGIRSAVGREKE